MPSSCSVRLLFSSLSVLASTASESSRTSKPDEHNDIPYPPRPTTKTPLKLCNPTLTATDANCDVRRRYRPSLSSERTSASDQPSPARRDKVQNTPPPDTATMNNRSVPRFNPAPEQVGMHEDDMSYKDKLDQKAFEARQPEEANDGVMHPIVEKVVEYVPVAAKVLGDPKAERKDKDDKVNENPPGPPERPLDDDKIEGFLRGQHKSKGEDGVFQ